MNFNLDGIKSRLLSGVSSDSELRQLLSAALTQKKEQPDRTWGMSPEMKRITARRRFPRSSKSTPARAGLWAGILSPPGSG